MDLVDRYLHGVRFWLPTPARHDIVAELSEDIRSQIEEREAELGRPLDDGEIESVLDRWGHPLAVAGRYLPQRALIGPALLPVYTFVLKMVLWCYLLPWTIVWAAYIVFVPSYRAEHAGLALVGTLKPLWLLALHAFAGITLLFAYLERSGAHAKYLSRWRPRGEAPTERDPRQISRGQSAFDLAVGVLFVLWWLNVPRSLPMELRTGEGLRILLAPALWSGIYWTVLSLALAGIGMASINLFHPWWTPARAAARLAIDATGLALVGLVLASGSWLDVIASGAHAAAASNFERWLNLSILITLVVAAAIVLAAVVADIRRLLRIRAAGRATTNVAP